MSDDLCTGNARPGRGPAPAPWSATQSAGRRPRRRHRRRGRTAAFCTPIACPRRRRQPHATTSLHPAAVAPRAHTTGVTATRRAKIAPRECGRSRARRCVARKACRRRHLLAARQGPRRLRPPAPPRSVSKSLPQAGERAEDFETNTCACAECGAKAEVNLDQLPGVVATCTGCGRHSDDSVGGGAAAIDMDHSPGGWTTAPHATVSSPD